MATIKKAVIKRSDLPPLKLQPVKESTYILVTNVQIIPAASSPVTGKPVFLYTTQIDHGFLGGDTITIRALQGDWQTDNFLFQSVEVLDVPSIPANQFYIEAILTVTDNPATGANENYSGEFSQSWQVQVAKVPEQYYIRYRVVSEDLNRVSHWSPIYSLRNVYNNENLGNMSILLDTSETYLNITWDMPVNEISTQNYDVYVAWGSTISGTGPYNYYNTISGNSVQLPIGATTDIQLPLNEFYKSVRVAVQRSTIPNKERIASLTVAEGLLFNIPYPG